MTILSDLANVDDRNQSSPHVPVPDVGEKSPLSAKEAIRAVLEDPTKLRDAALILGGVIYLSGYSVWSVLAWLEGLGPVPVLDTQYFVAGLPTVAALAITALLTFGTRRLLIEWWPEWVRHFEPRQRRRVQWIAQGVVIVGYIFFFLATRLDPPRTATTFIPQLDSVFHWLSMAPYRMSTWATGLVGFSSLPDRLRVLLTLVAFFAVFVTALLQIELSRPANFVWKAANLHVKVMRATVYMFPLLIGWAVLNLYVQDIYMNMPQSLGGARARPAVLDLRASEFSDSTLKALGIDRPITAKDDWVATSNELNVRYATDAMIIVEPIGPAGGGRQFFELSRDGVHALRWSAPAPPTSRAGTTLPPSGP